jgi:hypothetical protein
MACDSVAAAVLEMGAEASGSGSELSCQSSVSD